MSRAFAYARGRITRREVTRIGQLIHANNASAWAKRMGKPRGFIRMRVKDPDRWKLSDAYNLGLLLEVDSKEIEALVNAEIDYRVEKGLN